MTSESLALDPSLREQLAALAQELHDLVSRLQDPRPHLPFEAWSRNVSDRCRQLADRAAQARLALAGRQRSLAETLDRVTHALHESANTLAQGAISARPKLENVQASLSRSYEDLLHQIRLRRAALGAIRLPHLKPLRIGRSVFHVASGVTAAVLYEWVLDVRQAMTILLSLVALFGTLEITRRFSTRWNDFLMDKAFGGISRPWERHRTNSSTLYLVALTIMTALMSKHAVAVGALVLAVGDPAAAFIGKRFGRRKIVGGKSWAGVAGFFGAAFAAVLVLLRVAVPELALGAAAALAASAAAVGAGVEVVCQNLEDNFAIPILSAAVATLWF